jgi:hypothetical protein
MKNPEIISGKEDSTKVMNSPDCTDPELHTDKTAPDKDVDKTVKNDSGKSKLEINPDSTGIDTKANKTKKETEIVRK